MEAIEEKDQMNFYKMDFHFMPSLQQYALLKLADTLWAKDCMDLCQFFMNNFIMSYKSKYREQTIDKKIELIVREKFRKILFRKITSLSLPDLINDALYPFVEKVGIQKVKWYFYHMIQWNIQTFPRVFYYTSWGTIDRRKTAINLIKDDTLQTYKRYFLALFYCYEDELYNLGMVTEFEFADLARFVREYEIDMSFHNELLFAWEKVRLGKKLIRQANIDFDDAEYALTPAEVDHELLTPFEIQKQIYLPAYRYSKEAGNNYVNFFFRHMMTPQRYASRCEEAKENGIIWNMLDFYASNVNKMEDIGSYLENAFFLLQRMTASRREEVFLSDSHLLSVFSSGWRKQSVFPF